jgi:hypothetical protein
MPVAIGRSVARPENASRAVRRRGHAQPGAKDYSRTETAIWEDLDAFFDLIDRGHGRYGVAPYNGGLFDPDQHTFLREKRIPDWWMARVIDCLSRAKDAQFPAVGLCRVDYRDLAIQHLGGDRLAVAGPLDLGQKDPKLLAFKNEAKALAGFEGKRGVYLRVVGAADGKTASQCPLPAMPVFDGMAAAGGKVYLSLKDGSVVCFGR